MRRFIIAAALASAVAAPAAAQVDGPFTGFRLEGLAGYDNLRAGDTEDDGVNGFQYGVAAGYDIQLGGIVVGAEAEIGDSTGNSDETIQFGEDVINASLETGRDLYVGGRIGFPVADTTMIYGKAGYTNTRLESRFDDGVDVFDDNLSTDGFRLGAGAEFLFGPNAYGKVEYRYSNYNSIDFDDGASEFRTDIDLDRHQVVAGVGVRF